MATHKVSPCVVTGDWHVPIKIREISSPGYLRSGRREIGADIRELPWNTGYLATPCVESNRACKRQRGVNGVSALRPAETGSHHSISGECLAVATGGFWRRNIRHFTIVFFANGKCEPILLPNIIEKNHAITDGDMNLPPDISRTRFQNTWQCSIGIHHGSLVYKLLRSVLYLIIERLLTIKQAITVFDFQYILLTANAVNSVNSKYKCSKFCRH